jgi:pimeloyl-ACP methyl ester carboxylesterase
LIATVNNAWFRDFSQPTLRKVQCPVLALDGGKDLQVSAAQNLPAIRSALTDNPNAQIVELPNLSHLFQTATTGGLNEYSQIEETIAPVALDTMTDWIIKQDSRP